MPRARRFVILGSVGVVAVGAVLGGRALADTGSGDSLFRTAPVKRATVSQTLQRSGTIEPLAQGTVAFPIAGNVTSVPVQAGQTVTAGQTLATLDTTALQAAVTSKQASLAAAQLTLDKALNGQSSSGTGSSSTTPSTAARSTTATTQQSRSSTASAGSASLGGARQAVASGQQRVDGALSAARAALGAAGSSCAANPNGSSGPTFSSTGPSTTTTTAPVRSGASQQCVNDLQASLDAQQKVATAQSGLAQAESALDSLLSSTTATSSQSSQPSSSAAASSSPSSAELVADQAAVDAAQAEVTSAQQDLAQGTIVSPIDGTVAAVNLRPGDHVSAGSSTANVVVVGPGGYEVTTTVPVTDVGKLKLGDAATVLPDGSASGVDGKVVSIGVMPTTSGGTTVYPVVIGLTGSPSGLRNGAAAAVTITLSHVADALTVPTSAVRTAGGGALHVVTVVSGDKTRTVPVQVGAVGADLTEITSGVQEGQDAMLADLSEPVPSNASSNRFGGGGFGGAGFGGAGGLGGTTIGRGG